ncbi:COG3650 family protein [Vibrio panuliri]|uniref:Lipoprotein n=1 Tax=Vibrio panuliri TaxID=1381081 RepID=A0ABX3FCX1_9VIBR|nr:hypothetical protein [Vibrio panuliri]KAB1460994.1 hypothetical protein F7O85_00205 [Vibrio panuliri]OLQ89810.1 hypothetical protein BIY20_11235 [Vibrio panuliri]
MKALRNPAMLVSLFALQACSTIDFWPDDQTEQAKQPLANLEQPNTIKPLPFVLRGEVILGHEAQSIQPCGSELQYWLSIDNDKLQQAMHLTHTPYQPMYGEMVGHLETSSQEGFDGDYNARFVVSQINMLSAENPNRCDRPIRPTQAFGNEPFWSLSVESEQLTFQPMGGQKQIMPIITKRIESDRQRYDFSNGQLELNQRSCSDGMSDSLYSWTSTLKMSGKTYQGCATLSNADSSLDWIGQYQATSTQSSGFEIVLDMQSDHGATTTYRYLDGSGDLVERGYWQQLSPNQVQVVMTHHQQQPLLSERLFTRDGDQLTASKEKVGDVVYPIADGGLVLYKNESHSQENRAQIREDAVPSSAAFNPKVDRALREYFKQDNIDAAGSRYRWLTYDLNGDGQQELLVQLDWCGSGGCTLLIFENQQQKWRFNSRITLVNTPLNLGQKSNQGWQDLVLFVRGGGAIPNQHVLRFNNGRYPLNPSVAPTANFDDLSPVQLFSDGLTPHQEGVQL